MLIFGGASGPPCPPCAAATASETDGTGISNMELHELLEYVDLGELDVVELRTYRQDMSEELLGVVLAPDGDTSTLIRLSISPSSRTNMGWGAELTHSNFNFTSNWPPFMSFSTVACITAVMI